MVHDQNTGLSLVNAQVDANPEAEITWRKEGDRRVLGNFPVLDIGVVSRWGLAQIIEEEQKSRQSV